MREEEEEERGEEEEATLRFLTVPPDPRSNKSDCHDF